MSDHQETGLVTHVEVERARATAWKRATGTLPDAAMAASPYRLKSGQDTQWRTTYCLPAQFAELNLLPEVREGAMALFAELGIPWHAGVGTGPSNHLLSSQVQCVNALGQMVTDPERIIRAFGPILGTVEVLEVEPGRYLTFEYISEVDHFGEGAGKPRTRGAYCTSFDAAFLHRTADGQRELALIEWKYTEQYQDHERDRSRDHIRRERYQSAVEAPDSPVDLLVPFDALLDEPFYQLMRQQLVAKELEKERAHGVDRVRVVHIGSPANEAYEQSLTPALRTIGASVWEVWRWLLLDKKAYVEVDSRVFLDWNITSWEYDSRYGDHLAWDRDDLIRLLGTENFDEWVHANVEFDGDVIEQPEENGIELQLGIRGTLLEFPFSVHEFWDVAADLEAEFEASHDA